MRRVVLVLVCLLGVAALVWAQHGNWARQGYSSPAADVTSSGALGPFVSGEEGMCSVVADLTLLVGGSVTFEIQTSSNDTDWYAAHTFSSCGAAPCSNRYYGDKQLMRFVRLAWTSSGVSNGTADLVLECTP